jgi:5-methylcytosine-specific restriction protein B
MKRILTQRVTHALKNLSEWRKSVQSQASAHLFPLIALLGGGAGMLAEVQFDEQQDFEFWDRYLKLSDGNALMPYFNPLLLSRSEANFPHSNAATIRKNTFSLKWKAGLRERRGTHDYWKLADDYAEIIKKKMLMRAGTTKRVPALDVAIVLLRDHEFPDDATVADIETLFRDRIPQKAADYSILFQFSPESDVLVFGNDAAPDYDAAILAALIPEDVSSTVPSKVAPEITTLTNDDPVFQEVKEIIQFGTSGIVFSGPPGTGKSYYAHLVAESVVDDPKADIFKVQFHPSYGYEDFVEGFRPTDGSVSGFQIVGKVFLDACLRAQATKNWVVLLVDEINRGDPSRIFGEILTYIEKDYREEEFTLPFSGKPMSVPKNLLLLATMNPHDRSVSHVDAAFVRRFDHIDIQPSRELVEKFLSQDASFTPEQIGWIGDWFDIAQKQISYGLGHSFFKGVTNVDQLKLVWRYRIWPTASTAIEIDDGQAANLRLSFEALIRRLEGVLGEA